MEWDSNVPHVPWSRHLGAPSKKIATKIRPGNEIDLQHNNYKKRQLAFANRRNAISESNLSNGRKPEGFEDENNWDSQSDPGSVSSNKFSQLSPKFSNSNKISDAKRRQNGYPNNTNKTKSSLQGRGTGQQVRLRRRPHENKAGEDFIVEIPIQQGEDGYDVSNNHSPKYVHRYFDFIYYCCLTPNKWDRAEHGQSCANQSSLRRIQKIIYCYIVLLASFRSFTQIKYEILNFIQDRTLNQFIDIGYFLVGCVIHWYITYIFVFRQEKITKLFLTWENHEKAYATRNSTKIQNPMEWLPILVGVGTITMSILKSIIYTELNSLSFKGLILAQSDDTSVDLFMWKPDQLFNESFTEDYGTNLNWTTFIMGSFGLMANICWNLSVDITKDLLIWVAFINKIQMQRFGNKIMESLQQKKANGLNSEEDDDQCWKAYREINEVNSITNSTFNNLFVISHLHSFLISSYWLTHLLTLNVKLRVLIFVGYNVLKGIFCYFPARIAASENDRCRKWIQSLPSQTERFQVHGTPYTRDVMLLELEKEPLGLGRGKMFISNEFLFSFTTLVISLFCFLLNIKPKNEEETFRY